MKSPANITATPEALNDLLYQNFIKYDSLYNLVMHTLGSTEIADRRKESEISVFIDAFSMTKILYQYSNLPVLTANIVVSVLVNLAAHIRSYFITRHRTWCRIYIVYGNNTPESPMQYEPNYASRFLIERNFSPAVEEALNDAFGLLDILAPFLPDIYFCREKDKSVETAWIIQFLINREREIENRKLPRLIYTRDTYMYQLVANNPATFIFRPKKVAQVDKSYSVFKSNLYDSYRYIELKNVVPKHEPPKLDPRLFGLVLAYAGIKDRNVRAITTFKASEKRVDKMVKKTQIINGYNSPDNIPEGDNIKNRYKAIDLNYQYQQYASLPNNLDLAIVNANDPEAVRSINNKYFRLFPLDINRL